MFDRCFVGRYDSSITHHADSAANGVASPAASKEKRMPFAGHLGFVSLVLLMATRAGPAQEPRKIDFAHEIVPLLKARCAACHTNGKYKGSFSLDTRADVLKAKAVIPGKSVDSELFHRITSNEAKVRMPPKGDALSAKEIDLLKTWIDQGMPWEPGFSFKASTYVAQLKPRRPALPAPHASRDHPIDRLLDAYYVQQKLEPPPDADDTAYLRRVYLDEIGLLPTPEEADAFRNEVAADKRAIVARKLLADNRAYTEHWLTFWNDVLRNDYVGTGYIDGGRKQITEWLYRSLLDNKPFDQFARELISPSADAEGFIKGIKWRGTVNASQVPELQFAQNISQVFFGINMKCASCHDSFIDRWKLDDAYSLAAIIADQPLSVYRCDKPTGATATPRFVFPDLGTIDAKLPKAQRLEQLAKLVTHPDNGRFTRTIANRVWQRLMGRGLVHPVDIMANKPWSDDLLDYLAVYLADQKYDLKKLIEHIVTSRAYQAHTSVQKQELPPDEFVFRGPELKRLTAEQFLDAVWMLTDTGPTKVDAPVHPPAFADATPLERRKVRACLVKSDVLMRSLGRPNREQVVTTRPDQLSTLQALDLSNGPVLTDLLTRGAAEVLKAHHDEPPEQMIEKIYLRALSRRPTTEELGIARELVGTPGTKEGMADLLWAVVMLPEFQLVR
jgi:hypothetical protein